MKVAWNAVSTSPRRAWSPRGAPGPDRERPRQLLDAGLQGRPGRAGELRQHAPAEHPDGADGRALGNGARIERQVTDLAAQPLKETGEDLDFAIAGDGFFAVQTPQGVRYTRNGQFTAAANGRLVDQRNNPVLGQNGQPLTVGADGKVPQATVGIFAVTNARKSGDNLFTGTAGGRGTGEVRSGALEGSGAEPTRAMTDMIASLRAFESGQKVITTIDSTLNKAANQVGSM